MNVENIAGRVPTSLAAEWEMMRAGMVEIGTPLCIVDEYQAPFYAGAAATFAILFAVMLDESDDAQERWETTIERLQRELDGFVADREAFLARTATAGH